MEKAIFIDKFIQFPKNFNKISKFLVNKTTKDCIKFYYDSKTTISFKSLLKEVDNRRRNIKVNWNHSIHIANDIGCSIYPPKWLLSPSSHSLGNSNGYTALGFDKEAIVQLPRDDITYKSWANHPPMLSKHLTHSILQSLYSNSLSDGKSNGMSNIQHNSGPIKGINNGLNHGIVSNLSQTAVNKQTNALKLFNPSVTTQVVSNLLKSNVAKIPPMMSSVITALTPIIPRSSTILSAEMKYSTSKEFALRKLREKKAIQAKKRATHQLKKINSRVSTSDKQPGDPESDIEDIDSNQQGLAAVDDLVNGNPSISALEGKVDSALSGEIQKISSINSNLDDENLSIDGYEDILDCNGGLDIDKDEGYYQIKHLPLVHYYSSHSSHNMNKNKNSQNTLNVNQNIMNNLGYFRVNNDSPCVSNATVAGGLIFSCIVM